MNKSIETTINSQNCEFGYELISVIPYAYYLHLKGKLKKTISGIGSEPFYFFSPNHEINTNKRNTSNVHLLNTPNKNIHTNSLDKTRFVIPDYRKQFKNETFKFDKTIVVICNKYNNEWCKNPQLNRPINFFSFFELSQMFEMLQDKYQVIYINMNKRIELQDEVEAKELEGEEMILKEFPKVKTIYDFLEVGFSYNVVQLMIFANTHKFITLNGGGSILASFFKGTNIIYCKKTEVDGRLYPRELRNWDFSYYKDFAGSDIRVVHTNKNLFTQIENSFIK